MLDQYFFEKISSFALIMPKIMLPQMGQALAASRYNVFKYQKA